MINYDVKLMHILTLHCEQHRKYEAV